MTSFEGFKKCDEAELCDVLTGNCIKDTPANRSGKKILDVDGKMITGDENTIQRLQKVLGGDIKEASPVVKSAKKPKSPEKPPEDSGNKPQIPTKVGESREEIFRVFQECLKNIGKK